MAKYRPKDSDDGYADSRRKARPRVLDTYRPQESAPNDRGTSPPREADARDDRSYRPRNPTPRDREGDRPSTRPTSHKVTKRKNNKDNPSSKIHSLRNLLGRGINMPATVRREKERELAALLLDQQKQRLKEGGAKIIKKYHFVRFLERQKAEKKLKKLTKEKHTATDLDDEARKQLDESIHETEVDLNYAKYAPLNEKYISIFPDEEKQKKMPGGMARGHMNKQEWAILTPGQRDELTSAHDEEVNILRLAAGAKPPAWYEVEKYMIEGEAKLEAFRDGKLNTGLKDIELAAVGGKDKAALRQQTGQSVEQAPAWLTDDGMIDPADLDSDEDEAMDGGFFER